MTVGKGEGFEHWQPDSEALFLNTMAQPSRIHSKWIEVLKISDDVFFRGFNTY